MALPIMFVLNAIAILVLTFGLYFRRHRRKDMVVAYLAINVGLVAITSALTSTGISVDRVRPVRRPVHHPPSIRGARSAGGCLLLRRDDAGPPWRTLDLATLAVPEPHGDRPRSAARRR